MQDGEFGGGATADRQAVGVPAEYHRRPPTTRLHDLGHSQTGGGHVEIRLGRENGNRVLSVRDTGIGMTPDECEKIFDRFFRTTASQKFPKGSGLGLSIAKELVEMHSGSLTLTSEQGKGTTFTMNLPVKGEETA